LAAQALAELRESSVLVLVVKPDVAHECNWGITHDVASRILRWTSISRVGLGDSKPAQANQQSPGRGSAERRDRGDGEALAFDRHLIADFLAEQAGGELGLVGEDALLGLAVPRSQQCERALLATGAAEDDA